MWQQLQSAVPWLDWGVVLVYVRIQACILAMPGIGERILTGRIKVALAMALTPLLADTVTGPDMPATPLGLMGHIGAEMVLGFTTGMMLRLMAIAIEIASTAIAATASLSQIMGIQNEMSPHPIGNMLHLGGLAILMAMGLPVMLVELIADSMRFWPPANWPQADGLAMGVVSIVADSFWLALVLAAPFTLGGLLYQALSGVINRVMPALPVVFIGAPASILLALIGLVVLAPLLVGVWADAVLSFMLPSAL